MGLRRAERIARQDADDGDPDADVYVQGRLDKQVKKRAKMYHARPDCSRIKSSADPDAYDTMSRRAAHHRWLGPCGICFDLTADTDDATEATASASD